MTKLTAIQQEVLASAAARDDGAALPRDGSTPAGIAKITSGLLARKLAREIKATGDAAIWRRDKQKGPLTLVITSSGRKLISELAAGQLDLRRESPTEQPSDEAAIATSGQAADRLGDRASVASEVRPTPTKNGDPGVTSDGRRPQPIEEDSCADGALTPSLDEQPVASSVGAPRATKQTLIVDLLMRDEGASLDDLVAATGWLPHSARAALTGLRKRGMQLERVAGEEGASRYRLIADASKAS